MERWRKRGKLFEMGVLESLYGDPAECAGVLHFVCCWILNALPSGADVKSESYRITVESGGDVSLEVICEPA